MSEQTAQWKCDNQPEIDMLLNGYEIVTHRERENLLIVGSLGLEIELKPGDCLIIRDGRLGVVRVPDEVRKPKLKIIHTACAHCDRPIKVQTDILTNPDTVFVVCSTQCQEAMEFKARMSGEVSPLVM